MQPQPLGSSGFFIFGANLNPRRWTVITRKCVAMIIQTPEEIARLTLPLEVADELTHFEEQIKRYRRGELDETKMQKHRLHFGTYAQRQEGVQMQRIKIPGGFLSADQLVRLADASEL